MGVELKKDGKELIALLSGDIDHHTAKQMREEIDSQAGLDKPELLKLDFQHVDFMDSSGIG